MGGAESSDGRTEWREVAATCRICGAHNEVTCKPVAAFVPEEDNEEHEKLKNPSPVLSPDPAGYVCSECHQPGSAASSSLSVAYPDETDASCAGIMYPLLTPLNARQFRQLLGTVALGSGATAIPRWSWLQ